MSAGEACIFGLLFILDAERRAAQGEPYVASALIGAAWSVSGLVRLLVGAWP